ncbi:MAG: bifunctional DNA primase/polymerase [Chloroflexi bacterium]|nr:bifunctional DNA primase/polymerase [Chloroflexota bacterium]
MQSDPLFLYREAKRYAEKNWPVFPCHSINSDGTCTCKQPDCKSPGKHPLTPNGVKSASTDKKQVSEWWTRWPYANIGLALGNGKLVIDVDPKNGGTLESLGVLPETAMVRTGSGGYHLFFAYDKERYHITNSSGSLPKGVDVRGEGGYVIAVPSIHKSGKRYEWIERDILVRIPQHLLDWILTPRSAITAPDTAKREALGAMGEGSGRNNRLTSIAGSLRHQMSFEELEAHLQVINARFAEPLEGKEVERIARSVMRYSTDPKQDQIVEKIDPVLRGQPLSELLTKEVPQMNWVIQDLLPEGLVILAGKPKMGKSWFALLVGLYTASGWSLFGKQTTRGRVLYLGLEDSERRLRDRTRKLLCGKPCPSGFFYETKFRTLGSGGLEDLELWLQTEQFPRLVIIDTLAMMRQAGKANGNIYQEDYQFIAQLKDLADRYHVCILLVHHLRKSDATDTFDEVSGSTGLTGAADATMILKRERGKADGTLHITGRDVEEQELAMKLDSATSTWTMLGPAEAQRQSQETADILNAIAEGHTTPKEIAAALGKKADTIRRKLSRMVKAGEILSNEYGHYALPQTG